MLRNRECVLDDCRAIGNGATAESEWNVRVSLVAVDNGSFGNGCKRQSDEEKYLHLV